MCLRDGRPRSLPGPTSAPHWLQGGVRQPQTSQLRPLARGSSGTTHRMTFTQLFFSFCSALMMIVIVVELHAAKVCSQSWGTKLPLEN